MRFSWSVFAVLAWTAWAGAVQERATLTGIVRDAATGDTLAAANVRVLGTSLGTITNAQGRYVIALERGAHRLVVSSLGYRPDTLEVTITASLECNVALQPADITLPEIVVTSEDPAVAIIRQAIANKGRWAARLQSYTMEAFTRQLILRDTSIASINESYTTGYWQRGDTLREVVRQQRRTENVRDQMGVASVGRILNFAEERVRFAGYSFVGPIADDALEYYTYRLLHTHDAGGGEVYEIEMQPRGRTSPLFSGVIDIAGDSYALVSVDVSPNEAFTIPFVRERTLRYRQQFGLYEGSYWMPVDIRIAGRFNVNIPGISFPPFGIEQTSVIYNYLINIPLLDTVFQKPRLSVDSVALQRDTLLWAEAPVLPLSAREEEAYATLDSTKRLETIFRPSGLAVSLGAEGVAGMLLEALDVAFNRVQGFRLGFMYEAEDLLPVVTFRAGLAYGFSNKVTTYLGGVTVFSSSEKRYGVGGDVYRRIDNRPDEGYYGALVNSFTALLARNDYRDYFRAEGWRAFVTARPASWLNGTVGVVAEEHRSSPSMTDYSFFAHSRDYRPNPPVTEGSLRAVRLDVRLGEEPVPLDLVWRDGVDIDVEHTSPSIAGSDFHYTRYHAAGSLEIPTLGEGFLLRPSLRLRLSAGASSGALPLQRTFDLESSSSGLGPFGVLRALRVKEFGGTSYVALAAEHTFRSLPWLALGIPFLYENGIELLVSGAVARSWNDGELALATTGGWYGEVGIGLGRIFELLRADLTWRLSAPRRLAFTVATSGIL